MKQKQLLVLITLVLLAAGIKAQNVGIGTTTPTTKLDVLIPETFTTIARFRNGGGYNQILIENGTDNIDVGVDGSGGYVGTETAQDFRIRTGAFDRMFFQHATGNVGIGTTTPAAPLHIVTGANISTMLESSSAIGTWLNLTNTSTGGKSWSIISTGSSNGEGTGNLLFRDDNNAAVRMMIQSGTGIIGIGTITPVASAQLDVSSTTKGVLLPRMTTIQKNAISNPAEGLEVYDLTLHQKSYYNGSVWVSAISSAPDALPTIQIGTQKWMSKNLDVAFYRNGDPILQVTDPTAWAGLTTGAWCYYNNDSTLGNKYGKLYNWYALNDPRGLAPQGWHIPSDAEWTALEAPLGGSSVAGGKMKEAGTLNWTAPNTAGNNNSGWAGLPGGLRLTNGSFTNVTSNGYWWSATEIVTTNAWYCKLFYFNGTIFRNFDYKQNGFSVRCLRD